VTRYAAFLRAINVGGHTVAMTALRRHFEDLGCSDVRTVIASGNVLFSSSARSAVSLERRIAEHLAATLGYEVATFLRTPEELASITAHRAFAKTEAERPGHSMFVGFHGRAADGASRRRVLGLASDLDALRLRGREIYWLCRGRTSDSKIYGGGLEKALGQPVTLRNVTTVRKIAELLA